MKNEECKAMMTNKPYTTNEIIGCLRTFLIINS